MMNAEGAVLVRGPWRWRAVLAKVPLRSAVQDAWYGLMYRGGEHEDPVKMPDARSYTAMLWITSLGVWWATVKCENGDCAVVLEQSFDTIASARDWAEAEAAQLHVVHVLGGHN